MSAQSPARHTSGTGSEDEAVSESMEDVAAFTTMATIECVDELALFLVSLRHAHPTTPIWVATTHSLLTRLLPPSTTSPPPLASPAERADASSDRNEFFLNVLRAFAVPQVDSMEYRHLCGGGFLSTANIHWVPLIDDKYSPISRGIMEKSPGVFYQSKHADFMMVKATVLELALAHAQLQHQPHVREKWLIAAKDEGSSRVDGPTTKPSPPLQQSQPMVLFLDCDICTLAPWPAVPTGCSVALSRHGIRPADEAMWGTYNGGVVGVRSGEALFQWRKFTLTSRFHDQASLEDVAAWAGSTSLMEFPRQCNYGYWRMMQGVPDDRFSSEAALAVELRKFSMRRLPSTNQRHLGHGHDDSVLCYEERPLQSVHTHVFVPAAQNGSRTMPLFNALLLRWLHSSETRRYDHILRLLVR